MTPNRHLGEMTGPRPSPLDEPRNAAHAWARYRRLLRGMAMFSLVLIGLVVVALYALGAVVSIHVIIAMALGIFLTVMLMSALMGLVFLSSGTGHDEAVADPLNEDETDSWP
jgi:uncharacterized membrane protein